jgi:hypothetical protein
MINSLFKRAVLGTKLNSQTLNIYRSTGSFINGRWTEDTQSPPYFEVKGIAYPSSTKELDQVPEGDRIKGAMSFITTEELYVTRQGSAPGLSDKIEWRGELYKIVQTLNWMSYGTFTSIAIRITGD